MKRFFVLVLITVAILTALPAMAQKTYVNGIDPNYPPFAYVDEKTGQPTGFDVDSMNWIAKTMGFTVEHKPLAWDGIIPALLARQIDMVCSGMSITPQRARQVAFSEPYWQVSRVFLVKATSGLSPQSILKGSDIQLGVQRGTSEAAAIAQEKRENQYGFTLRFYDSAPLAVEDVLNGRIDAAFMDDLPARDAIVKGRQVKIAGAHGEPDNFGVAMRKEDTDLRKTVNEGYRRLTADPYWKELQIKYLSK
ncbi:MAG: ABC transporter substrate-binding protein [Desulfovibrio sp.]|jgi:polar amino acid transport system substrate-binding protein|nr:ABC transporter substrate-binding protein [Desulfovibrio sp.]